MKKTLLDNLAILGLHASVRVSAGDVRKKYRELARKTHPDLGGDEKEFKKIQGAYEEIMAGRERMANEEIVYDKAQAQPHDERYSQSGPYDTANDPFAKIIDLAMETLKDIKHALILEQVTKERLREIVTNVTTVVLQDLAARPLQWQDALTDQSDINGDKTFHLIYHTDRKSGSMLNERVREAAFKSDIISRVGAIEGQIAARIVNRLPDKLKELHPDALEAMNLTDILGHMDEPIPALTWRR